MNAHQSPSDDELERVAAWLAQQRPAPPVQLQRRGRLLVRRAVHERAMRHRAAVLLATGTTALGAAVMVAVLGG